MGEKMTKKRAKEVIEEYKDLTNYFDNSLSLEEMEKMLRYRMAFGDAETRIIIASLIIAGAKFKQDYEIIDSLKQL